MNKSLKKEIILYSIIVIVLITISIFNNFYWKLGKKVEETNSVTELEQLEVNNITYNVPYEEQWLD